MSKHFKRALLLILLASGLALTFSYRDHLDPAFIATRVTAAGPSAPLLFIGLYTVATVLFLPGSVLTLAGGALFGPVWGTLYSLCGATLGAVSAFLITRYVASNEVQARLDASADGQVGRLIKGIEAEGWRFVAFTRLVPLFPFNLLNYAFGLTRIPLLQYTLATFAFMLPGALAYTYLGYAGREALMGGERLIRTGLIALALLAAAAFLPRLVARLREKPMLTAETVRNWTDTGHGLLLDVRSAVEFVGEQGHIAGALNLPLDELESRIAELGDEPDRPIAIVCRTDRRSSRAAALLTRCGFANARVMRGGMTAWLSNGWPVEGQSSPPDREAAT